MVPSVKSKPQEHRRHGRLGCSSRAPASMQKYPFKASAATALTRDPKKDTCAAEVFREAPRAREPAKVRICSARAHPRPEKSLHPRSRAPASREMSAFQGVAGRRHQSAWDEFPGPSSGLDVSWMCPSCPERAGGAGGGGARNNNHVSHVFFPTHVSYGCAPAGELGLYA